MPKNGVQFEQISCGKFLEAKTSGFRASNEKNIKITINRENLIFLMAKN